ncbi:Rad3-related DNA helicase [Noviherbaspirillum humi]|uniref:Rad3-related DNA helicase n=1 Tax=Noviherbaspirillum humi TaxID=1688639 RepID=A0A239FDP7_9BURK|nr:ATP-dependent DNA helicase [Noviherbaspirillum humi]SNS54628.1 Rad3-related DNA helicase [Noviherbaspirillum humi]
MQYVVAVRALCEFTAKAGGLDMRFTPSPTAQEGIAGHQVVAGRRPASYQSEISLEGEYDALRVRGRADGYDPDANRLEEVKTYRGKFDAIPGNHRSLHWAQARIYGWLLCKKLGLSEMTLALVYFNIGSQQETVLTELHAAAELEQFFNRQCERFLAWARQEMAHREARDAALQALRFPHADFRPGQRQLAEAVYRAASQGRCLLAQAPTGIGKTIASLFPMLKACPTQQIDKVFFLAAKTSGRGLALETVRKLEAASPGLPLRVIEIVARDKACEHPDKACHGDACPLAQGFYDRLPKAREAAVRRTLLDRAALREVALAHDICPYYLSQDMARWSDVVVGDYNYYFDLNAMLHALAQANGWRVGVLVDEAHNLVDRARKMYGAELDQFAFRQVRRTAPPALKRSFDRIQRAWKTLHAEQEAPYQVYPAPPADFLSTLQQAGADITDYLAEQPQAVDGQLQQFYFDLLHFTRVAELFGEHSLFDISLIDGGRTKSSRLCLRNVLPAPFLKPRFAAARSTTLFSATLSPWHYFQEVLGLPDDMVWTDVESPFSAEQLDVHVVSSISTRYQHRDASLAPIADLMASQYAKQPGNYLAFFSSYDYLEKAAAELHRRHPEMPTWLQSRRMDEAERDAFIARFTPESRGIGFAVLGGAFGEGIDLPGARLIGAFVATLGLPQVNPVNQEMQKRLQALLGSGYAYTYLYPGLQKVVQAAGRVIRTREDVGVVYLIDDRFNRGEVRGLLPGWWQLKDDRRYIDGY